MRITKHVFIVTVVVLSLTCIVTVWNTMFADSEQKTSINNDSQKQHSNRWNSFLDMVPERPWSDVAKNIITSEYGGKGNLTKHELRCLPNRSRLVWYQPSVIGNCEVQWVMLPSREIKKVQLIPDRYAAHLGIDDMIVAPDSSAIWIRVGRSVGERHWAAKYFKYDLTKDVLEYTNGQLQKLVEEEKGDIQSRLPHPVWARFGHKQYMDQDTAEKAKVCYTDLFWARLQDDRPISLNVTDAICKKCNTMWTICPGLRGRGHIFSYQTGDYVCRIPLLSDAQEGFLIFDHPKGSMVYSLQNNFGIWKSMLKNRTRIMKHSLPDMGIFIHSQDAKKSYLDFVAVHDMP